MVGPWLSVGTLVIAVDSYEVVSDHFLHISGCILINVLIVKTAPTLDDSPHRPSLLHSFIKHPATSQDMALVGN